MNNPLLKKLQVKPGYLVNIANAPANFNELFDVAQDDVDFSTTEISGADAFLIFAITKNELMAALGERSSQINKQALCWIIYPKASSKLSSDLNLMQNWEDLKSFKLTPCASAAIDATWTAIRIKPEGTTKKSGVGNNDIKQNEFAQYIDVVNKSITLPDDLRDLLQKNQAAFDFYHQLSYSNKKEYVLWILTAKQEKTRLERLEKTVAKLNAHKKNPSEK